MSKEILMAGMVAAGGAGPETRVLLLVDNRFGANGPAGMEGRPSIAESFESFGWQVEVAAPRGEPQACVFAAEAGRAPVTVQKTVEIASMEPYDAVVVEPDASPEDLAGDLAALALLREAKRRNRVIAAFGRGVKVLAVADVVAGHRVQGPPRMRKSSGRLALPTQLSATRKARPMRPLRSWTGTWSRERAATPFGG